MLATRPSLLEVVAASGHAHAATTFGLALAVEAVSAPAAPTDRVFLWVREAAAVVETGDAYGPGLMNLGVSPDALISVVVRTQVDALRAALEGARSTALSAVVLETMAAVDLTASRRLKLASEKSGVAVVLIRLKNEAMANAVPIRWRVSAAPQTIRPGSQPFATFKVEVLKHPAGLNGNMRIVEWDHERHSFTEALSLSLAAVSDVRPLAA